MRQASHSSRYAISGSSGVYHLLYPDQDYTLCGLRVEKHDSAFFAKAALHMVEFAPPNRELCKHCDKMKQRRKAVVEGHVCQNHDPEDPVIQEKSQTTERWHIKLSPSKDQTIDLLTR